jgi:ubiquinone/menaquinone biosynthesis C-methylase UbiE
MKTIILDLACGQNKVTEAAIGKEPDTCTITGVDVAGNADVIHDLFSFPYPFESESVDEIYSSHFIEHIPMEYVEVDGKRKDMLFAFVDEVYRMLKPGGKATLIFPCATSIRAFQDPTHRRFIPATTAYYFNKEWRTINKLDHYNVECDFDFVVGEAVNGGWSVRSQEAKQFAGQHYWNVVDDLHFILTKRKTE